MENAMSLAGVIGPVYVLLGLSVLLHVNAWQKLVESWKKDHFGLFTLMLISAILGILIIRMYNVWEWNIWLIVTLTGWLLLVKSVLYFLLPGSVIKAMMNWKNMTSLLYIDGLVILALGAVLTYYVYWV